jgi:dTDP-4-dehydrorhamnose reductase
VLPVRVLVTGGNGQVARALGETIPAAVRANFLRRDQLDITDPQSFGRVLDDIRPATVINAAAYTAVDRAETEPDAALRVNGSAVGTLAEACASRSIRLIHISTDFVFDGQKSSPYEPQDQPNPLSVYGATKLEGEKHVRAQAGLEYLIVRTAWVYSKTGRNFLTTMLRLFSERSVIRMVADQVGTPTSAHSLAQCLWRAAMDAGPSGTLHFTDAGVASWYDFSQAIYEEGKERGLIKREVEIRPIRTDEYPTPAHRPAYSVLEKSTSLQRLNLQPIHWRLRLREVLSGLTK